MGTAGLAAALALFAASEPPAPMTELNLSCEGHADVATQTSALSFLARGGVTTHTGFGSRREDGRVLFRMADGAARVHLPRALITAVNSGGEDGWWPVADLKVTDGAITGRLHLNLVNRPGLRIDRTTGDIDLGGDYPFHGDCEKAASTERKF